MPLPPSYKAGSDREKIPKPSRAKRGQDYVHLSTLIAAKLALYGLMIKTGTWKAELARKLGIRAASGPAAGP